MATVLETCPAKRPAGRPRSEMSRKAILDATARLLESVTLRNLAIENIAREAGVGKATIYRWWPNKAAIVIDAFFQEVEQRTAFERAPSAAEAIRHQVVRMVHAIGGPIGRIAAQIIAEGQSNPDVLEHFRAVFLRGRRAAATEIFRRGIADGEFHPDLDIELAIDLIYGPIWYRLMVGHQPLDHTLAERLPNSAFLPCCARRNALTPPGARAARADPVSPRIRVRLSHTVATAATAKGNRVFSRGGYAALMEDRADGAFTDMNDVTQALGLTLVRNSNDDG